MRSRNKNKLQIQNSRIPKQIHPTGKNAHYEIIFSDNGIGFEDIYKAKIFELFQSLHVKEEYEGTGIGLSIVKKVVEAHEGTITVETEVNKGTTFFISIPKLG